MKMTNKKTNKKNKKQIKSNTKLPAQIIESGRVSASIWRQKNKDDEEYFTFNFYKKYKDKEGWHTTKSFNFYDALHIAHICKVIHGQFNTKIVTEQQLKKFKKKGDNKNDIL